MKAVLVPLNDEESGGTESDNDRPRKRKGTDYGKATGKKTKFQEDHEFSPLRFSDYMGNTQELRECSGYCRTCYPLNFEL